MSASLSIMQPGSRRRTTCRSSVPSVTTVSTGELLIASSLHQSRSEIFRTSLYGGCRSVRALRDLSARGIPFSSESLADAIGVTAAQIRRDLSYFGRFGKQGKGYDTEFLGETIAGFLKLDRQWDVALVGYGNLGRAITHYRGLVPSSFRIAAIFDRKAAELQEHAPGIQVLSDELIESEVAHMGIRIGIIAVPAGAAQEVADRLIAGGVLAISTTPWSCCAFQVTSPPEKSTPSASCNR